MRILLADDERAIAITLRDDLERVGHKVTLARDGLEARALLSEHPYDVLISDIKMPGATGWTSSTRSSAAGPRPR